MAKTRRMVKRVNHVAMVVNKLEDHLERFQRLFGLVPSGMETFPQFGTRVAFIPLGGVILEFLEAFNDTSDMARFLKEKGEGIHHLCFEVEDIDREMKALAEKGVLFMEKEPRQAPLGKVIFLHPQSTGGLIIQLCQRV